MPLLSAAFLGLALLCVGEAQQIKKEEGHKPLVQKFISNTFNNEQLRPPEVQTKAIAQRIQLPTALIDEENHGKRDNTGPSSQGLQTVSRLSQKGTMIPFKNYGSYGPPAPGQQQISRMRQNGAGLESVKYGSNGLSFSSYTPPTSFSQSANSWSMNQKKQSEPETSPANCRVEGRTLLVGDQWSSVGICGLFTCNANQFRTLTATCPPINYQENSGCDVAEQDMALSFPHCCPRLVCPNYERTGNKQTSEPSSNYKSPSNGLYKNKYV